MRRMKPLKGGRPQHSGRTDPLVRQTIDHLAHRFNVSRSFVINEFLALGLGMAPLESIEEDATEVRPRKRKRHKR